MTRFVYLAGPILDCNSEEANDWRQSVAGCLKEHNLTGISPLRCEPIHGPTYTTSYEDDKFGTSRAIANKNLFDVHNCDMVLAYLPKPPAGRKQSWGTICEIAWAKALGKQVVLVTNDPEVVAHPVVNACAGWVLSTLEDGIDVIVGILAGYAGGKNV